MVKIINIMTKKNKDNCQMKKLLIVIPLLFLIPSAIYAWSDHMYYSREALSVLPEVTGTDKIKVEKFEDFLKKETAGLSALLKEQETFLKKTYSIYPPLPESLIFNGKNNTSIKTDFLKALRVNPNIRLGYYIQEIPGEGTSKNKKINIKNISVFKDTEWLNKYIFYEIKTGEQVAPLEVISTASDEPDYGHDIHLFTDNNSDFGKEYGFGVQPFGDPKLEFSSQAPFHMGYYHESFIIFAAAGFLKQTYPEIRVYQYMDLAKFAFKTGHPYWGWRFLGWGLHYAQDMTQPYHAKVLPGAGTVKMLMINMSSQKTKDDAVQNLSDRHLSFENYILESIKSLHLKKMTTAPIFLSLRKSDGDAKYGKFDEKYTSEVIADESYSLANDLDDTISECPVILKFTDHKYKLENFTPTKESENVDRFIDKLMINYGAHTRNMVRATLADR